MSKDSIIKSQDINEVTGETVGGKYKGILNDTSLSIVGRMEFPTLRIPPTHGMFVVRAALVPDGVVVGTVLFVVFNSNATTKSTLIAIIVIT